MKPIKMLSIGNSFTEDAYTYMSELLVSMGVKEFKVCYLYIGGSSLLDHVNNLKKDAQIYSYRKYINGKFEVIENYSAISAIMEDEWDIITIQQVSDLSGDKKSYEKSLEPLLKEIDKYALTKSVKYYFHMTWSYPKNSNHEAFNRYNHNQLTMYNKILEAVKEVVIFNPMISRIIPTGTLIQNLRNTKIKDNLNRDGIHLNMLGRYAAALMWIRAVFNIEIDKVKFKTKSFKVNRKLPLLKKWVMITCNHPFKITNL